MPDQHPTAARLCRECAGPVSVRYGRSITAHLPRLQPRLKPMRLPRGAGPDRERAPAWIGVELLVRAPRQASCLRQDHRSILNPDKRILPASGTPAYD